MGDEPRQRARDVQDPARAGRNGAGPALATGALELVAAELVRRVADGLEGVIVAALEEALDQRQAPALLDRRGLAHALAVGVDTIDRLRKEGCPELAVGDSPRFELEVVLTWLRSRGQGGAEGSSP